MIVSGYIATFPLAGLAWHYINYIEGLLELGHEVYYIEDLMDWSSNPIGPFGADPDDYSHRFLQSALSICGDTVPYAYHSARSGQWYGLASEDRDRILRSSDLMICVSAGAKFRPEEARPRCVIAVDTDPVYTQLRMASQPDYLEYYRTFDAIATFGVLIGNENSDIPTHGLKWIPTRQPVALQQWPFSVHPSPKRFTTLTGWSHRGGHQTYNGITYHCAKDQEWLRMLDLPRRAPWAMEIAVETKGSAQTWALSMPYTTRHAFRGRGWILSEPLFPSLTSLAYKNFVRSSAGEFTVAKEQYTHFQSGWFSDRSAVFLATGRPVVTQETGFSRWLPTGEGLLTFTEINEAAEGLHAVASAYTKHARAARHIAEEFFDAKKVLSELLDRVM